MRSFLKRHGALVTATAGVIACFSFHAILSNQNTKNEFTALVDLSSHNLKPVRFLMKPVTVTGEVESLTDEGDIFEAPVRLKVGEQFLNKAARQMYPSPAMFDIDRDGQLELVVGDISGRLNVYENLSDEKSDPVWSSHIPVKLSDGANVKVSNW